MIFITRHWSKMALPLFMAFIGSCVFWVGTHKNITTKSQTEKITFSQKTVLAMQSVHKETTHTLKEQPIDKTRVQEEIINQTSRTPNYSVNETVANPFIITAHKQQQLALRAKPKRHPNYSQEWSEGFWSLSQHARAQFIQHKMPAF